MFSYARGEKANEISMSRRIPKIGFGLFVNRLHWTVSSSKCEGELHALAPRRAN